MIEKNRSSHTSSSSSGRRCFLTMPVGRILPPRRLPTCTAKLEKDWPVSLSVGLRSQRCSSTRGRAGRHPSDGLKMLLTTLMRPGFLTGTLAGSCCCCGATGSSFGSGGVSVSFEEEGAAVWGLEVWVSSLAFCSCIFLNISRKEPSFLNFIVGGLVGGSSASLEDDESLVLLSSFTSPSSWPLRLLDAMFMVCFCVSLQRNRERNNLQRELAARPLLIDWFVVCFPGVYTNQEVYLKICRCRY